eukprot:4388435-Pleurochrysis_carterae.AAC.2
MSEIYDEPTDSVSPKPTWDASQVLYVITSHERAVVTFIEHVESVYFRLDTTYTFQSSSPVAPVFPTVATAAPAAASAAGRSTRAGARVASSSFPSQPTSVSAPPRALIDAERARFVISPEHIDDVDRQLMESILNTIDSAALSRQRP